MTKAHGNKFQLKALDKTLFEHLFTLSEDELRKKGVMKIIADECPGFPCRVSLEDAKIGEEVILLNYEHHSVNTPYKASGPIFIRHAAKTAVLKTNEIPPMFTHRLLSLRGYNNSAIMVFADVTSGENLKEKLHAMFDNKSVEYIHIHNAKPGCFNCVVERVG
jgi:hypothetical protein